MLKVGKTLWINLREAQNEFGVSRETLRRAINRGEIKAMRISRNQTLVRPEEVARWKAEHYHPEMAARVRKRWQKVKRERKK